jgi:hypothetical protein
MRWVRFAGFAALGPITGPLACGFFRCLRARRSGMAMVYALGIAETYLALPMILLELLRVVVPSAG